MSEKIEKEQLVVEKKSEESENRLAKPGVVVELIKGEQWSDELSGISLFRGFYEMADHSDMATNKELANTGYVKRPSEKSPTAILPKGKNLSRVEKALTLGILKIFDPKNPSVYKEITRDDKTRVLFNNKEERGYKYRDKEDEEITRLLSMSLIRFKETVNKLKTLSTLEKIYEAEYEGRNPEARPRKAYVEIIKERLKSPEVSGVSTIKSKVEEKVILA